MDKMGQRQKGNENIALQAGRDLIEMGGAVTIIVEKVIQGPFTIIVNSEKALNRAASMLGLLKMKGLADEDIGAIQDEPALQMDIGEGIKSAIKREDLHEHLARLIKQRIVMRDNDFRAIVLSDAINTIDKITLRQLDTLTVVYFIVHIIMNDMNDYKQLSSWIEARIVPLVKRNVESIDLMHLQACRCLILGQLSETAKKRFKIQFPKLEFDLEKIKSHPTVNEYIKLFNTELAKSRLTTVGIQIGAIHSEILFDYKLDLDTFIR